MGNDNEACKKHDSDLRDFVFFATFCVIVFLMNKVNGWMNFVTVCW